MKGPDNHKRRTWPYDGPFVTQREAAEPAALARFPAPTTAEVSGAPDQQDGPEFVSIPEWSRRVDCSRDTGYRLARRGEIPGQFRIGTLLRVNWDVFVRSTESGRLAQ
jgi:predicted DNA-binding transcriptional regulator AlpA